MVAEVGRWWGGQWVLLLDFEKVRRAYKDANNLRRYSEEGGLGKVP
jgi:hypothetical protein